MAQNYELQIEITSNIDGAIAGFDSLKKAVSGVGPALSALSGQLNTISKNLDDLEKGFKKFGRELTTNVTAPIAALAALSLKNIYDSAVDGKGSAAINRFAASVQNLKEQFSLFLRDIGSILAPTLTTAINLISGLLEEFRKLSRETKTFIIATAAIVAAIGPASLAISSFLAVATQLTKALGVLVSFGPKLIAFFVNPFTAVVVLAAAIASLGNLMIDVARSGTSIGDAIYKSLKLVSNYINKEFWPMMADFLESISLEGSQARDMANNLRGYGEYYKKEFENLKNEINEMLKPLGTDIGNSMTLGLKNLLKELGESFDEFFSKYGNKQIDLVTKESEERLKSIVQITNQIMNSFAGGLADAFLDFAQGAKTAEQAFNQFAQNFLRQITQMILQAQIFKILNESGAGDDGGFFRNLATAAFAKPVQSPGGATGMATGGYVSGPGTGTSDSIPTWLSNGEFVMTAAAVKKFGTGFFDRINSLARGPSRISKSNHFADGGLVTSSQQAPQVVIENSGSEKTVARTEFDPVSAITTVFLEDVGKNGPISKSIQSNFGIKRGGYR